MASGDLNYIDRYPQADAEYQAWKRRSQNGLRTVPAEWSATVPSGHINMSGTPQPGELLRKPGEMLLHAISDRRLMRPPQFEKADCGVIEWDEEAGRNVMTMYSNELAMEGLSAMASDKAIKATGGGMTIEEAVRMMSPQAKDAIRMMINENDALRVDVTNAKAERDGAFKAGFSAAKRKFAETGVYPAIVEEPGAHDYHGPTEPVLDSDGVPTHNRRAVADVVHERFHKTVGDVLAGKVIPAARKQMRDALDKAPKFAETTASTAAPMNPNAIRFNGQQIGLRLP